MTAIRITAKVDGFRRAGIAHPASPTDHPADSLTPEQIEVLRGEPMLVVEEIAAPAKSKPLGKAV